MTHRLSLLLASGCLALGLAAAPAVPDPSAGIDRAFMDPSVRPCDDFYQFANGGWLKQNPVPPSETIWGGTSMVRETTRNTLKAILEETSARRDWKPGSVQQKVGDFFASGMDGKAIEKAGTTPIRPDLKRIQALKDPGGLPALLASLHDRGLGGGFGFYVGQDQKASTRYLAAFTQGGLGLPDRDYYTKDDAKSVALRAAYRKHVARMFELLGEAPALADRHAWTVMDLEARLAKASFTKVEQRDPNRTYHKMSPADLAAQAPGFDWTGYLKARGVPADKVAEVNVRQPGFFKAFAALSASAPLGDWKVYLTWQVLTHSEEFLPKAFGDEHFSFFGRTLNGIPEPQERWKRVQAATGEALGEALGELYVARAFPPESKRRMLVLVENLRAALADRIRGLDWMSQPTKEAALHKLAAFGVKIGYPDRFKDYGKVRVSRDAYGANVLQARAFEVRENLDKLGCPIDRAEWHMSPQTVNAYYSPTMNEIVFPAAILQAPLFDAKADDACNYGGIGAVIGHEMSHGFDDSGSQYDAEGNLRDWWQEADRAAYKARTDLVVRQYDAFKALPDQNVNGRLTLGENIADLGGLKIAFAAWKKSWEGREAPAPVDGWTGEQRFFLNFAAVWRNNIRDEALRVRLNTDVHSPGRFRVLGPLADLPEFHQAFGCGDGTPMNRPMAERPAIW